MYIVENVTDTLAENVINFVNRFMLRTLFDI